jgi:PncC family amidohydrolase
VYNEEVINRIKEIINRKDETVAVAESVTSGHLQVAFSLAMEASQYFQGGITAYNIGQKTRHLNIEPTYAIEVNCVAEKVSADMAIEVSKKFISDYGVGITGYATIVPQCEKEGLFAYFCVSYKNEIVVSKKLTSKEEGNLKVQLDYTNQGLKIFLEWLEAK